MAGSRMMAAGFLLATGAGAALAQGGPYVLSRATEWPDLCHLTLTGEPAIGGMAVSLGRDCARSFRWTVDIAVWRRDPGGALILANPTRKGVARFEKLADGDFIGAGPDGINYVLTPDTKPRRR